MFCLKDHPLTVQDDRFIAAPIAVAGRNPLTAKLMLHAVEDFGFADASKIQEALENKLLSGNSSRPSLMVGDSVVPLMSSSEWFVGVFGVGSQLTAEHVRLHMSFVNILSPPLKVGPDGHVVASNEYSSGKELWGHA